MNIKRPFAPGFLNKLDNWLLLHKPDIWSTRVHLVLYYSIITAVAISLLGYIAPMDYHQYSSIFFWTWLTVLVSIIGFVVWMIYLLRFNVFKRYGELRSGYSIKTFCCYFVAVGCFVLLPFLPSYMETFKTKLKYTKAELIQDINTINTSIAQLEYDSVSHDWKTDTLVLRENLPATIHSKKDVIHEEIFIADSVITATDSALTTTEYDEAASDYYTHQRLPGRTIITPLELADYKTNNDSVVHLYDDVYILYNPPHYQVINSYQLDKRNHPAILNNREIYKEVIENFKRKDPRVVKDKLETVLKKYYRQDNYNSYPVTTYAYDDINRNRNFTYKYQLASVEHSISNIAEKLSRFDADELPVLFRIFLYVTLGLTLLVYIYRHTEKRSFFLAILTAILLLLFTSVFSAFNGFSETFLVGLMLFYISIFFILSLTIWQRKVRSTLAGIGLNLFTYTVFGVPLLIVFLRYLIEKQRYRKQWDDKNLPYDYSYPDFQNAFSYAEIGGFVLLLVLIATYIHKTYRRWYALPEN